MTAVPERARVVIIGAGFAGAATAWALTRAGVRDVLVLEREPTCGYHASGRNAALGRQLAEDDHITALTVAGAAFLREPPSGFAHTPLLAPTGSILLVDDEAERDHLAARARRWKLAHELVSPRALAARWPILAEVPSAGGVAFPDDGVIDVHALLEGFLRGARAAGAEVVTSCEVLAIAPADGAATEAGGPGPVRVDSARGSVHTEVVVNAAGAWVEAVGRAAGARPPRYAPIQRHLFITGPVPELDHGAPFVWHLGSREFYVRPERTGYLLSGCDETEVAPCDAVPAAAAAEALAGKLAPLAPGLADLGIARAWACLRTFAPDRRPVIGWDPDRPWLFWVAGLGGHGATAAAAVGSRAAALLRERLPGSGRTRTPGR
ncbi:NAD(P)/FAD-dependent oxidoreductase [Haliangium sp.]|uniref:NAD(P)/FAD-dependent oxidoreductase n=1 Tax=Haliangium sp. TaxID=2663208 RepID=UPI003D106942